MNSGRFCSPTRQKCGEWTEDDVYPPHIFFLQKKLDQTIKARALFSFHREEHLGKTRIAITTKTPFRDSSIRMGMRRHLLHSQRYCNRTARTDCWLHHLDVPRSHALLDVRVAVFGQRAADDDQLWNARRQALPVQSGGRPRQLRQNHQQRLRHCILVERDYDVYCFDSNLTEVPLSHSVKSNMVKEMFYAECVDPFWVDVL